MSPDLDLTRRAWTKTRGPITAIGTWLRLDGSFQPCIVLIRAGSERDDRLIPCVVTLSRAYVWDQRTSDMKEAVMTAIQFADTLRLSLDSHTISRLMLFINDMLGDLIAIPPYRPDDAPTVVEATLINHTTGRTVETEMKDV